MAAQAHGLCFGGRMARAEGELHRRLWHRYRTANGMKQAHAKSQELKVQRLCFPHYQTTQLELAYLDVIFDVYANILTV